MSSNSQNMTLEEKIVEQIKRYGLHELLDDEDAIAELAKRAVKEALIQPRRIAAEGYYGRYEEKDSPIVEAARKMAEQIAVSASAELAADAEFQKLLREAMAAALPNAIGNSLSGLVMTLQQQTALMAMDKIREHVRNGLPM